MTASCLLGYARGNVCDLPNHRGRVRVWFNCVESDSSLIFWWGMIISENRFPLFGIMP
jgi:hypothetical protein